MRKKKNTRSIAPRDLALLAIGLAGYWLSGQPRKTREEEKMHDPAFQKKMLRVSIIYKLAGILYNE